MLKAQDVLVTLRLASLAGTEAATFATLGETLSMSASEVFAATQRAAACRLLIEEPPPATGAARYRVSATNLGEFLISGLRYVFPGELGKPVRGFPTAQDAMPLSAHIIRPAGELPVVWPHFEGDTRGYSLKPIYRSAPDAARRDPRLAEWLALADALRLGDARVRTVAAAEVSKLIRTLDDARNR